MVQKIKVAELYERLRDMKKLFAHPSYKAGEEAFTFTLATRDCNLVELEKFQYDAIASALIRICDHMMTKPNGKLYPAHILFRYRIAGGKVTWNISLGGKPYAVVKFNSVDGLIDGVYGEDLPVTIGASPIIINHKSDITSTDIIFNADINTLDGIMFYENFDDLMIAMKYSPATYLHYETPDRLVIHMKFAGDIGGSNTHTLEVSHNTESDTRLSLRAIHEFRNNSEIIKTWFIRNVGWVLKKEVLL